MITRLEKSLPSAVQRVKTSEHKGETFEIEIPTWGDHSVIGWVAHNHPEWFSIDKALGGFDVVIYYRRLSCSPNSLDEQLVWLETLHPLSVTTCRVF